jgi:hypothetical protein
LQQGFLVSENRSNLEELTVTAQVNLYSNLIKRSKLLTVLISILKPKKSDTDRKDGIGFYVRTDPEDAESDKIKIYVSPYESGELEEILEFVDNFRNLTRLKGLEENGPALFQHARLWLCEDALANFVACHNEAMWSLSMKVTKRKRMKFLLLFLKHGWPRKFLMN